MTDRLKSLRYRRSGVSLGALLLVTMLQPLQAAEPDCYTRFETARYPAARALCQEAAELGDARAAFLLATMYYQGLSVSADDQRGLFWDKVAAENGYSDAAYRLALAYQLGQGSAPDKAQAVRWYMQAARAHHAKAQRNLGALYENGSGVGRDPEKAYFWYLQAAKQGLGDAQLRVGAMLLEGHGAAADRATAQHWIRKSAQGGNHNAQLALGVMLAQIDPQDSVIWYQKSAEQGNLYAKQNLALVYFSGQGVAIDYPRALQLAQQAVDSGNSAARPLLGQIQLKLQQQEVARLQAEKAQLAMLMKASRQAQDSISVPSAQQSPAADSALVAVSFELPTEPTAAGPAKATP